MSCAAGGALGGLSLPYAQHALCPIQMKQLQIHLHAQDHSRLTAHRHHGCLIRFPFPDMSAVSAGVTCFIGLQIGLSERWSMSIYEYILKRDYHDYNATLM